jgi:hypothetical protein
MAQLNQKKRGKIKNVILYKNISKETKKLFI